MPRSTFLLAATLVAIAVGCVALGFTLAQVTSGDDRDSAPAPTATTTQAAPSPTPPPTPTATPPVMQAPLAVKVGQLIMSGFSGITAEQAAAQLSAAHIGNAVLVGENVGTPEQILALTEGLQARAVLENGAGMLISIDQEGGRVIRLDPPFVQFPAAGVIGCIGETEFARGAYRVMAEEMLAVGINVNLAPVADVTDNPANTVIGDRAFGSTPDVVSPMVAAAIAGTHDGDAGTTIKHFPGHGSTGGDSHDGQVVVTKSLAELEQTELPPFRESVADSELVMMANVDYVALDPASIPAGLSGPTIALLRDELGYDGVVITDALGMGAVSNRWGPGEAAVMAIAAGADMVLFTSAANATDAHAAIVEAVLSGRIPIGRIDEAVARILALKQRLPMQASGAITEIGSAEHQGMADLIAQARASTGC